MAMISELQRGDQAKITGFTQADRQYRQKLLAMGLTPGVVITIKRVAPLGDPIELNVRGYALTLRRHEAQILVVEKINNDKA